MIRTPTALRQECLNCRFRYPYRPTPGAPAMYSNCHRMPPLMLPDGPSNLRTWYPIVGDVMFCGEFRFTRGKAAALASFGLALSIAIVGVVLKLSGSLP